jgi:hypothetical protein
LPVKIISTLPPFLGSLGVRANNRGVSIFCCIAQGAKESTKHYKSQPLSLLF